jgi:hypothetical protein
MRDKITNIESVHNFAALVSKRLMGESWLWSYPCLSRKRTRYFEALETLAAIKNFVPEIRVFKTVKIRHEQGRKRTMT